MEVLVGQVLAGGSWNLAICGKRASTLDLPEHRTLGFWKGFGVQVPVMPWSFGSMVGVRGQDCGAECTWRSESSPLHMLRLHDLWVWSVVSEKQLSTSSNRMGPFWAGPAVTVPLFIPSYKLFRALWWCHHIVMCISWIFLLPLTLTRENITSR